MDAITGSVGALMETCSVCGLPLAVGEYPCIYTVRPHGKPSMTVVDDSIPGGMIVENMGKEPLTFYSKSEWKRAMAERGLVNRVQHTPVPGTDKSPYTTRWV